MKITGKDLINTYIENDNGKLLKLYMETCASVGLHVFHDGNEAFDAEFYRSGLFIACNEYSDPSSEGVLQLFMTDEDLGYELTWDELAKMNIDNLATQTPEEKEALDTMTGISREHLLKMIKLQTKTIKELNEELNSSESPNCSAWDDEGLPPVGSLCKVNRDSFTYRVMYSSEYVVIVQNLDNDNTTAHGMDIILDLHKGNYTFSKPESPQQREERERLDAAEVLYNTYMKTWDHACIGWDGLDSKNKDAFLAIVDKTNYRKESN